MLAGMAAIAETHDSAYRALTEGAGLFDRSEIGKLALTGDQAAEMLNGQVSNDVEALAPGTGCYAALLTNKGKMLGDLRVLHTGEELLLITERSALQALFDQLRPGGVLVCPVRRGEGEHLMRFRDGVEETVVPVRFVPLVSE